jgi:Zn-dependent protease with chaperone function
MSGGLIGNAPTGLYGWIRGNDARSLQFFAIFAVAVQLLAALVLFLPLTLLDEAHSPLFGPLGYVVRYGPLVFALSLAIFGLQLFWYMETVRKRAGFRFVDASDEPRLCALAEPLIVLMDMKPPFVAVIETAACNAFACGISRQHAVLVITRGLLDTLSDDELECVLAHELTHIRNGDIRMMAAANICMANLKGLDSANILQFRHWLSGVWCLAFPFFFPLMLFGGMVGQAAIRAAWRARFTIISSREFIADANAVQLTKNPAALASALTRIRGREEIEGLSTSDDAMMIAGRSEGPDATHPQVEDRVEALARVTGPMVFNAPGAPASLGDAEDLAALRPSRRKTARQRAWSAFGTDLLGMTRISRIACGATLAIFLAIHAPDLGNARAMTAKFDIRTLNLVIGINEARCMTHGIAWETCSQEYHALWRRYGTQRGTFIGVMAAFNGRPKSATDEETDPTFGTARMRPWTGESGRVTGVEAKIYDSGHIAYAPGEVTNQLPEHLAIAEGRASRLLSHDLHSGRDERRLQGRCRKAP